MAHNSLELNSDFEEFYDMHVLHLASLQLKMITLQDILTTLPWKQRELNKIYNNEIGDIYTRTHIIQRTKTFVFKKFCETTSYEYFTKV